MRVIILGICPGRGYSTVAFPRGHIRSRLEDWIHEAEVDVGFDLVWDNVFRAYRKLPLNREGVDEGAARVRALYANDLVLALGKETARVCNKARLNYFELPHPSGRNRKLNNGALVRERLHELRSWLSFFRPRPVADPAVAPDLDLSEYEF